MTLYKVGEQRFVLSGQSVLKRTLKSFTVREIDQKIVTQRNKIAPGIPIALRPLVNQVLDPRRTLGKRLLAFAYSDRYWLVEGALQLRFEVGCFRSLPLALRIATHALWESERRWWAFEPDLVRLGH
jgi:hypothetical protein